MAVLEALEAAASQRGFRVRFDKVTECVLPAEGEPGCATLDEAKALLERVQKVAAVGGIRNAHIVYPDGSLGGIVRGSVTALNSDGQLVPIGGLPRTEPESAEPIPATGPLRIPRERLGDLTAAVERINSLPREPSERLRALRQDAEDEEPA